MTRAALFSLAFAALVAAAFATSPRARQAPDRVRFEYLRLHPVSSQPGMQRSEWKSGYRACRAASPRWICDEPIWSETGQRQAEASALAGLGAEGWELMSVHQAEPGVVPGGATYLFKRRLP